MIVLTPADSEPAKSSECFSLGCLVEAYRDSPQLAFK
jgi:hypothetical protein